MKTIKLGYSGNEVEELCELLKVNKRTEFDEDLKNKVIGFQKDNSLDPDGIVGFNTWMRLFLNNRENNSEEGIHYSDYIWAGKLCDCEPEVLMAVVKVETGGDGGFVAPGKPKILFEGHIFWKQLMKRGIDPNKLAKLHPTIIYKKWTKEYYKGGIKEYDRLEEAEKISYDAALSSISMGLFQIMGFNYASCGCETVKEMWSRSCKSEAEQFGLGLGFIKNSDLIPYLQNKNWTSFAKKYNGPEYYKNQYDKKLKIAYESYK